MMHSLNKLVSSLRPRSSKNVEDMTGVASHDVSGQLCPVDAPPPYTRHDPRANDSGELPHIEDTRHYVEDLTNDFERRHHAPATDWEQQIAAEWEEETNYRISWASSRRVRWATINSDDGPILVPMSGRSSIAVPTRASLAPLITPTTIDSAVSTDLPQNPSRRAYTGKGKARAPNEDSSFARQVARTLERWHNHRQIRHDARHARQLQDEYEREARLHEERTRARDCIVCGDSKAPFSFPASQPTSNCTHPISTCSECSEAWIASEFDTKGCEGIKCPECSEVLQYADVERLASRDTFVMYDRIAARNAFAGIPGFAWCLASGCEAGQVNVTEGDSAGFMQCDACGYKQCTEHRGAWHTGESCKAYEWRVSGGKAREEERLTMATLEEMSKICPGRKCGWRIEKVEGCDHMTCKKCRCEFCWICMADHKRIRSEGNTAHAKECLYHSDKLDIAWPFNVH